MAVGNVGELGKGTERETIEQFICALPMLLKMKDKDKSQKASVL